jgi:hypothetical protein
MLRIELNEHWVPWRACVLAVARSIEAVSALWTKWSAEVLLREGAVKC